MSEEEIIESINNGVQIHMRLSRLIQKQYKKEATEEKQRRIAVEQESNKWKAKFEKLAKDMAEIKITAQETRSSSVVSNFASAISINMKKMEQFEIENDKLRNTVKSFDKNQKNTDRLVEQNNILIQQMAEERDQIRNELKMWKEREQQSKLHSEKLLDQNTQLLQQINQLQTEVQILRDEQKTKNIEEAGRQQEQRRSTPQQRLALLPSTGSPPGSPPLPRRLSAQQQTPKEEQRRVGTNDTQLITKGGQMQNYHDGNIYGKFVFVGFWLEFPDFLSSDNVECIYYLNQNLDSLYHNVSSYEKELFVWTYWKNMNTTSGYANFYANLLSLCRQWKRLRPDGEIHCLYSYEEEESPAEPDKELVSLLTTCNKYLFTDNASKFSAFRQYWPKFVDLILSEETKKKYPK